MKQKLFLLITFLCSVFAVSADELIIGNVTIPKGGQGTIVINYHFDVPELYSGWQFSLALPGELSTVKNDKGTSLFTAGTCHDASYTITSSYSAGVDNYVALSLESSPITGNDDILLSIPVVANNEHEVGTVFNASLTGIQFGNKDGIHTSFFDDVNFTITIGKPADTRIVLDELSTTAPEDASGVDVRVIRTIKAGDWSSICLPFAMTEEKCSAAFGDDVELADFSSWSSEEDDDGNIISLELGFTNVTEIEANHPYIIKVSENISEFNVDDVDIEVEEEPTVQVGKKKAERGYFIGTYVSNTEVPSDDLFLSGNKFWYSAGTTKMKAFRGYFELADVLTEVEEAGARIAINIGDNPTGIKSVTDSENNSDVYFDLMGRRMEKPRRGIYIVEAKKVYSK